MLQPGVVESRFHALGRACHLVIGDRDGAGGQLLDSAEAELRRIEGHLGARSPGSVVHRLNHPASPREAIALDPEAAQLFAYAAALRAKTGDKFDPTTQVLTRLWKGGRPGVPSREQIQAALSRVGWQHLQIGGNTASMQQPGLQLSLNSCVRPYAADAVRRLLVSGGVTSALIDLDGDVATIGRQADGSNWLLGLRYPRGPGTAIHRLKLGRACYSLRGNLEHRVTLEGRSHGAAIDPETGYPLPGLLSVAAVGDSCLEACAAATVGRFLGQEEGLEWLGGLGLQWLAIDHALQCHGPLAATEGLSAR